MITKEDILADIKSVQLAYRSTILPLNAKLHYGEFNFYWDVLQFIIWIKVNHPNEYHDYWLNDVYKIFNDFGDLYVIITEPEIKPFRYEDGILDIDKPIEVMISNLYEHVINLNDSRLDDIFNLMNNLHSTFLNSGQNQQLSRVENKIDTLNNQINPPKSPYKTKKEKIDDVVNAEIKKLKLKK